MRSLFSLLALLALGASVSAADLGPTITTTDGCTYVRGADGQYYPAGASVAKSGCICGDGCTCPAGACPAKCPVTAGNDALAAVNAKRAARGLRPFQHDPLLAQAAQACAAFRAKHRLFGHTSNDFQFVPPGASASSAGCAAYPASYGFMACCVYENYTHAGAASVMGVDGKMYHHIFVRSGGAASAPAFLPASIPQTYTLPSAPASSCPNGQCGIPQQSRGLFFRR